MFFKLNDYFNVISIEETFFFFLRNQILINIIIDSNTVTFLVLIFFYIKIFFYRPNNLRAQSIGFVNPHQCNKKIYR